MLYIIFFLSEWRDKLPYSLPEVLEMLGNSYWKNVSGEDDNENLTIVTAANKLKMQMTILRMMLP